MTDVELSLDACIKCNICVSYCPPAKVTDLFPGPKYAGPQAQRFRSPRGPSPDASVDYCSGCRVCNLVCPAGVRIAELNAKARARMYRDRGGVPLRNRLLGRSELLGRLAHPVAPLANYLLHNPISRWLADAWLGIDRRAPLPRFSLHTFPGPVRSKWSPASNPRRRVVYFHGCATRYYEPWIGRAAVAVLERNGMEVVIPPQNCCSLPMLSNGEFDAARRYYDGNLRTLAPLAEAGCEIVGTSTSCTLTLKEEAPDLLEADSDAGRLVAASTSDICEYLVRLHEAGALDTAFRPLELSVLYHAPCQLNAHRVGHPAADLMRLIPGLTVIESEHPCCGIAGTYGLKKEKYAIGMAVGQPLFDRVQQSGARLSVCDSETCRWQIVHGTGLPSVHPIEILAWSYGLGEPLAIRKG
ncbi:MAG TPA: anaerobic glycerol-3-phosphate dehydrogenase subunit C [bacterium]|nr:anaerobic glycerol-3-phosphate dehydrogenase subunit C [bacterium]